MPNDVYELASEVEVVRALAVETAESSCKAVAVDVGCSARSKRSGFKRNLAGAFTEVDSDDETLSQKYGKIKKGFLCCIVSMRPFYVMCCNNNCLRASLNNLVFVCCCFVILVWKCWFFFMVRLIIIVL